MAALDVLQTVECKGGCGHLEPIYQNGKTVHAHVCGPCHHRICKNDYTFHTPCLVIPMLDED